MTLKHHAQSLSVIDIIELDRQIQIKSYLQTTDRSPHILRLLSFVNFFLKYEKQHALKKVWSTNGNIQQDLLFRITKGVGLGFTQTPETNEK
jgi:hypothetical protein